MNEKLSVLKFEPKGETPESIIRDLLENVEKIQLIAGAVITEHGYVAGFNSEGNHLITIAALDIVRDRLKRDFVEGEG